MKVNLVHNPIKLSQPAGAALAFMGIKGMLPLWHGVQGCTAFAKILFISHFKEPMPFQNTAIGQSNVVMGSEDNMHEALLNVSPNTDIIGVLTTGVTETSGFDLYKTVQDFKDQYPHIPVVSVNTPDFVGTLSDGYAKTCKAILKAFVKNKTHKNKRRVAVFPGPYITPGEIETLRTIYDDYGITPVFVPDLGDSLLGTLEAAEHFPHSQGGTSTKQIKTLANVAHVFSIGRSMKRVSQWFSDKHEIPITTYDSLATLSELDRFHCKLEKISGKKTPEKYVKERKYLMDTILDTNYFFQGKTAAVSGDPELIIKWKNPLEAIGIKVVSISSSKEKGLTPGDLFSVEKIVKNQKIDFLIGNSHVAKLSLEINKPIIRSGIPVDDRFGEPQSVRIGYAGAATVLHASANAVLEGQLPHIGYTSPLQSTLIA